MNKRVYTWLCCALFAFEVHAQNFLINEDFNSANDTVPPSGWVNRFISGDASVDKFQFSTQVFHFAKPLIEKYVVFDSYNGGSTGGTATNGSGEEAALISPIVSTSGLSNLTLSIDKQLFVQAGGSAYIEVSTNGGSSWTTVFSQTAAIVEGTPTNLKISLNSYTGYSSFRIRFRWYNSSTATYRGFFAFDNVQLYESKSIDVRVSEIVEMYNGSCPSTTQSLDLTIYNAGTSTVDTIPVVLKIGSTTLYDTIYKLGAGGRASAFKSKTFNASSGGNYQFTAYTNLNSDLVRANDTLRSTRTSSPPPAVPTGDSIVQCGVGSATLSTNRNQGDSTYWFLQASGGTDVGTGNPFTTPVIDKTTTFYVENSRVNENEFSSSAGLYRFNAAAQGPGSMFNVYAKNDIILDSISQHFAYAGSYKMDVYYRSGAYQGYETNSGAWTKLDLVKDTLFVTGYGKFYVMRLKKPLRIPAGSTYGFYVDASTTSITFTNGALDDQNADVRVTGNTVLSADFTGVLTGYYWNGQIFFRKTCSTGRKAITVTVLNRPKGSKLVKGSTFDGVFRSGTLKDFDVASEGRTISYELIPPTGYSNADFGVKWAITGLDMLTVKGTSIPTGDTTLTSPGSTNGKMTYKPSKGWEDSTIVIRIKVWEAITNCDTTIERYIFVAPAPRPNFEAPNVCLGTSIQFNNKTTLASGYNTYLWDLGDGNTSTFESPIHTYTAYGKYKVKLTATSNYGIQRDTTIQIEVFEIPDVEFSLVNACEGKAIAFTNSTTISSGSLAFNWNFGDGSTSKLENPSHLYNKPGGYTVTLSASANGCTNALSKFATQFPRPKAGFSSNGGCVGAEIEFINSSTIGLGEKAGSRWYFDDGNLGTLTHPRHVYTTPGTKQVKLVSISQFGCRDSIVHPVIVKPSPIVNFTYDKNCDVDPVSFTNLTSEPAGVSVIYSWAFGDGQNSTQKSPKHNYSSLGAKIVHLVATANNGCSNELSKNITILVQPVADFDVSSVCSGDVVRFINKTKISAGDVDYKWYFGDGDSSDFNSPTKQYNVPTTTIFNIKLEAAAKGGCTDVVTKTVTIHEKPNCGFTLVQSKVDRRTFTFVPNNASYGDNAYTWILKGSKTYKTTSPTHTFEYYDEEYNIILDVTGDNGCNCYDSSKLITTSWPLGVEEVDLSNTLQIFPNPSTGKFVVAAQGLTDPSQINVYGSDGRLVASFSDINLSVFGFELNLSHLASGSYVAEVYNNKMRQTKRLVIAR